ncbi:MAG: glycosyltransferase, partial [Rhizobiales bacterium]|nr:glycosyltransferase [Hyphomicrobiales bacterium]
MTGTQPLRPFLAIIVPVFKHSVLVNEAIDSALSQETEREFVVIAVDDGCPFGETRDVLAGWRALYPGRLHAISRPNGGLSAARNSGLRYALGTFPDLEAVFLLDADNRLERNAVETCARKLQADSRSDWFYPVFDVFGFDQSFMNGGDYSLLLHSKANICEAGSLIRRRILDAGIRFDESMRLGFEDWEFWLSCAEVGFRGAPFTESIFRYRRRAESMLTSSDAHREELIGYIRRKHAWLYNPRAAIALEAAESPRFAILFSDTNRVAFFTDPQQMRELELPEVERKLYAALADEHKFAAPAIWLATTEQAWNTLREAGLLRFALFDIERRLGLVGVVSLSLSAEPSERFRYGIPDGAHDEDIFPAAFVAVSLGMVRTMLAEPQGPAMIEGLAASALDLSLRRQIVLPSAHAPPVGSWADPVPSLGSFLRTLRNSPYQPSLGLIWRWRDTYPPPYSDAAGIARTTAGHGGALYPVVKSDAGVDVGFALPFFDFGGVEKVAAAIAHELRREGFRTHLFLIGQNPIVVSDFTKSAFDSLNWFISPGMFRFDGRSYLGARTSGWTPDRQDRADLVGLVSWLDVLINAHSSALHEAMAEIRGRGVVTISHEHVIETSPYGRPYGPPHTTLAFEHAYDFIASCSNDLAAWLHGQGVPADKLIAVPNGPGYPLAREAVLEISSARQLADRERPLRILFLGRFDYQKGLDRLQAIIKELDGSGRFEFTVVGKAIINHDAEGPDFPPSVRRLAPVYAGGLLTELYASADILLLPSRFEGLPLTILEAQRCGCVVIATDVGANR